MSIAKANKISKSTSQKDIFDTLEFKTKILTLYTNEFNDILEKILVKAEGEFMRTLAHRVEISLSEKYSDDMFESISLRTVLRSIEKEIYLNVYKKVYPICKQLEDDTSQMSQPPFFFLKHCNYQSEKILHRCPDGLISTSFAFNDEYILCKECSYVYKTSCVKLYCNFCSVEYYTNIGNSNGLSPISASDNSGSNYQPATWEKYHCNIVYNDQMRCIECKEKLMIDIPNNKLLCLNCGFNSDPYDILWRCMVCSSEFKSNAKIYNPLEYKTIKNTIKNALIEKDYARPLMFPCNHEKAVTQMNHKTDCNGILYIGYYNETKMIICSKCNIVTLYDRYIWKCPICNKRFRDKEKTNEKTFNSSSSFNPEDNEINSLNSSTNDSGNIIEKKLSLSRGTNEDSPSSKSEKRNSNTNYGFIKVSISQMPKLILKKNIPKIDLTDFTIISQIAEGTVIKVYAVNNNSNQFYALKRRPYSSEAIGNCIIQYSIKFSGIVSIKGIHVNEDNNELNVLEELGICDLDKEIISRRRTKKYYTELELLNMIYQLSLSLSYLQLNGYVHYNVCTSNIIIFKDAKFKLSGFSSLKEIGRVKSDETGKSNSKDKVDKDNESDELIKAEAFNLGLVLLYTSTFIEQSIEDIVSLSQNITDVNTANDKIREIVEESLVKSGRYSEQFIELVLLLLNSAPSHRFDFFDVNNYITTHFGSN